MPDPLSVTTDTDALREDAERERLKETIVQKAITNRKRKRKALLPADPTNTLLKAALSLYRDATYGPEALNGVCTQQCTSSKNTPTDKGNGWKNQKSTKVSKTAALFEAGNALAWPPISAPQGPAARRSTPNSRAVGLASFKKSAAGIGGAIAKPLVKDTLKTTAKPAVKAVADDVAAAAGKGSAKGFSNVLAGPKRAIPPVIKPRLPAPPPQVTGQISAAKPSLARRAGEALSPVYKPVAEAAGKINKAIPTPVKAVAGGAIGMAGGSALISKMPESLGGPAAPPTLTPLQQFARDKQYAEGAPLVDELSAMALDKDPVLGPKLKAMRQYPDGPRDYAFEELHDKTREAKQKELIELYRTGKATEVPPVQFTHRYISPSGLELHKKWYGREPMSPEETNLHQQERNNLMKRYALMKHMGMQNEGIAQQPLGNDPNTWPKQDPRWWQLQSSYQNKQY